MKQKFFTDRVFYEKLYKLALPIAFQSLMLAAVAAADAFMLGRLDQNAMSAVSLATQIQFVQNLVLSAAVSAFGLLGAQYWGKGDTEAIEKLFLIEVRVCGLVSLLFFAACELIPGTLMLLYTNEPVLIEIGIPYLRIAGWSYLFTGISQCYLAVMKVTDHAADTARISSLAVVLNIILNAILIYGLLFFPAMGVEGAATATLIARIAELALCVLLSLREGYMRLPLRRFFRRDRLLARDFAKEVLPLVGAGLFWGVGFTAYSSFMGHLGTDAAAANSVTSVVRDLVCCLCNGFAFGGGILVGNELGAGRLDTGKLYGDRIGSLSFLVGFASTLIMLALTYPLLKLVSLTGAAQKYLLQMMLVMSFYMIGRCVNTAIINGVFTAGGDTMFDFYSLAVAMWCIAIPLAALGTYVLHWPVWVVYACTCLDEVGKIPWVVFHFRKYKWVRDLTREAH